MKRKLKGMNTLDLRIRIKELLDTGLISEEEYKMLLYVYVKDLKTVLEGMGYTMLDDKPSGKDYTIYDINFLAQKERLIHKSLGTDAKRFITMAIEDLDFDDELAYEYYHRLGDIYEIED